MTNPHERLRKRLRLTHAEVAHLLGISTQYSRARGTGHHRRTTFATAEKWEARSAGELKARDVIRWGMTTLP